MGSSSSEWRGTRIRSVPSALILGKRKRRNGRREDFGKCQRIELATQDVGRAKRKEEMEILGEVVPSKVLREVWILEISRRIVTLEVLGHQGH